MRYPAVVIGDEGLRLLVATVTPTGQLVPVVREDRVLGIAAAITRDGTLSDGTADLIVETARRLAIQASRVTDRPVRTLVTGTLATDADHGVLARLAKALGSAPQRLRVDDQARLTLLAATAPDDPSTVVVLRQDRHRLQLALASDGHVLWATETDLGTDELIGDLQLDEPIDRSTADPLADVLQQGLRTVAGPVQHRSGRWRLVVGGPLARDLVRAVTADASGPTNPASGTVQVTNRQLLDMRAAAGSAMPVHESAARGLPNRHDRPSPGARLSVAAATVAAVADALWTDDITIAAWGVPEGAVLDMATGTRASDPPSGRRRCGVGRLADILASDPAHTRHVAFLATQLFDATRTLHGLDEDDRDLLGHAARLHDIAGRPTAAGQQRIGGTFLQHAALPGFADEDLAVLACLVRFHRGGTPTTAYPPYGALGSQRRRTVAQLAALLQIADGLDRHHDTSVTQLTATIEPRALRLIVHGPRDRAQARSSARPAALTFQRIFNRELHIDTHPPNPTVPVAVPIPEQLASHT